jgi:hypothetical protein
MAVQPSLEGDQHMPEVKGGVLEQARWEAIERGVREDAARLARLVLDGLGTTRDARDIAKRIDSVRRQGPAADY